MVPGQEALALQQAEQHLLGSTNLVKLLFKRNAMEWRIQEIMER